MEIVSNIALISINETLVIQLVSFLLFVFIINRVMFRPLRSAMAERERYLARLNDEIVSAGQQMEQIGDTLKKAEEQVRKFCNTVMLNTAMDEKKEMFLDKVENRIPVS